MWHIRFPSTPDSIPYTAPLPLPPLIAAIASLLLLLIPLMILPSRLLLLPHAAELGQGSIIKLPIGLSCCHQDPLLNYCKIRQFRCKVFTRLHHFRIDFAKFSREGLAGPSPLLSPVLPSIRASPSIFEHFAPSIQASSSILGRCVPSIRAFRLRPQSSCCPSRARFIHYRQKFRQAVFLT